MQYESKVIIQLVHKQNLSVDTTLLVWELIQIFILAIKIRSQKRI